MSKWAVRWSHGWVYSYQNRSVLYLNITGNFILKSYQSGIVYNHSFRDVLQWVERDFYY